MFITCHTCHTQFKPLKDKMGKTVLHGFIELINESKRQPNKLWVDQGREFYNNFIQKSLDNNDTVMYSSIMKVSQ